MSRQGQPQGYQNHACVLLILMLMLMSQLSLLGHKLHYVHAYTYCFIKLLFVSKILKPCLEQNHIHVKLLHIYPTVFIRLTALGTY